MKSLIVTFMLLTHLASAQFKTLTYVAPQVSPAETTMEQQEMTDADTNTQKKEPRRAKKVRLLKKQNDSLKNLLNAYQEKATLENNILLKSLLSQVQNMHTQKTAEQKTAEHKTEELHKNSEPNNKLAMPLNGELIVTSPYGKRYHPLLHKTKAHNGVDLRARYQEVYTVLSGTVTAAGWDPKGGGNYIKIRHSGHFETSYLHLSKILVTPGEKVEAGNLIAISGNTGNSTGPHLHFTVRENGRYINPLDFLNQLININNTLIAYHGK